MTAHDSRWLLQNVAAENSAAEREVFARYAARLTALAAQRLPSRAARMDAEDVAQSALVCFFAGAKVDRWQHDKAGDLWRLLAGIVVNKCRAHSRKQRAARRDVRRTQSMADETGADLPLVANTSAPSQQVLLWEAAVIVFRELPPEEQALIQFKLDGADAARLAMQLN